MFIILFRVILLIYGFVHNLKVLYVETLCIFQFDYPGSQFGNDLDYFFKMKTVSSILTGERDQQLFSVSLTKTIITIRNAKFAYFKGYQVRIRMVLVCFCI